MSMSVGETERLDNASAGVTRSIMRSVLERWFIWFGDSDASRAELAELTEAAAAKWPGAGLLTSAPAKPVDETYDAVKDAVYGEEPPAADEFEDLLG